MPSDTLRDRDVPAEVRPAETDAPAQQPGTLDVGQIFLKSMEDAQKASDTYQAQARSYLEERAKALQLPRERLQAALEAPQPEPPVPPGEIKPPTPGIRPFAEGMPGESNAQILNRTLMSLGLLAQMGVGVAKGNPQGALAAYTGALRGWQEGDMRRGQEQWAEYIAYVNSMQRAWRNAHTIYEDTIRRNEGDIQRANLELGIAVAKQDEKSENVKLAFQDYQGFMDRMKFAITSLEHMKRDSDVMTMRAIAQNQIYLREQETARHNREMEAIGRENQRFKQEQLDAKPIYPSKGGHWYDEEAGKFINVVPQGELMKNPTRYHDMNANQQSLVQRLTHADQVFARLNQITPEVLAKHPVENVIRAMELRAQGKVASNAQLREFSNLVEEGNIELTNVFGSGGQFRVGLMNVLRKNVGASPADTIATALRTTNTTRTSVDNRLFGVLHPNEKLPEYRMIPKPGKWQVYDTRTQKVRPAEFSARERLPEFVEPIAPIEGE